MSKIETTSDKRLSEALVELKDSAAGLSEGFTELQEAITEMEQSTRRLSETQAQASHSLSDAAASLSNDATRGQPDPKTSTHTQIYATKALGDRSVSEETVKTQIYTA